MVEISRECIPFPHGKHSRRVSTCGIAVLAGRLPSSDIVSVFPEITTPPPKGAVPPGDYLFRKADKPHGVLQILVSLFKNNF